MTSDSEGPSCDWECVCVICVGGGSAGQSLAGSQCMACLRGVAVNLWPLWLSLLASGMGLWGLKSVWGWGHVVAREEGAREWGAVRTNLGFVHRAISIPSSVSKTDCSWDSRTATGSDLLETAITNLFFRFIVRWFTPKDHMEMDLIAVKKFGLAVKQHEITEASLLHGSAKISLCMQAYWLGLLKDGHIDYKPIE